MIAYKVQAQQNIIPYYPLCVLYYSINSTFFSFIFFTFGFFERRVCCARERGPTSLRPALTSRRKQKSSRMHTYSTRTVVLIVVQEKEKKQAERFGDNLTARWYGISLHHCCTTVLL